MKTVRKEKPTLWVDQYGNKFYADTLKKLKAQIPGRVSKMYWENRDQSITYHVGYVIGDHWLNGYVQMRKPA